MNPRMGAFIGGVFGLIYVVVNAGALPSVPATLLRGLGIAAFLGLLMVIRRADPAPSNDVSPRSGFGRAYWLVVAGEVAVGGAGLVLLNGPLDAPDADVAWISLVVGVHFFGLASIWREPFFRRLGAAIALCGTAGLIAAAAGSSAALIATVGGIIPGALMLAAGYWGTALGGPTAHGPRSL